jgi:hypothetical protein
MAFELHPRQGMAWTYRRKTRWWRRRLNRVLDVVVVVLAAVFLVELFLLFK